jgi:drug/metabolite transporter (DMT)-like permease
VSIFFPVLASSILGVTGQLLLKIGMTRMGSVSLAGGSSRLVSLVWSLATNIYVLGGLVIFGTGVFFWLIALSRAPLSYTYPFASLSYALVAVTSFFILHEKIGWLRLAGILTICSGVLLVAIS